MFSNLIKLEILKLVKNIFGIISKIMKIKTNIFFKGKKKFAINKKFPRNTIPIIGQTIFEFTKNIVSGIFFSFK